MLFLSNGVPLAQDWSDGLASPAHDAQWVAIGAASLLGLSFLGLLLRGWLQRDRYRATEVLGESERAELAAVIESVEERTSGEIVVVVLERSDRHPAAPWIAGVGMLLLGSAATARWMPWDEPLLFFGLQLLYGGLGLLAGLYVAGFRRAFVTEARATEMAEEQALQEFHRFGLHRTVDRTGVLLFVSLLERRVVVLGDEGINAVLDHSHWIETDAAILNGVRSGSMLAGLKEAVQLCSQVLIEHFPAGEAQPNQVPNHVIVRAE